MRNLRPSGSPTWPSTIFATAEIHLSRGSYFLFLDRTLFFTTRNVNVFADKLGLVTGPNGAVIFRQALFDWNAYFQRGFDTASILRMCRFRLVYFHRYIRITCLFTGRTNQRSVQIIIRFKATAFPLSAGLHCDTESIGMILTKSIHNPCRYFM